MKKGQILRLAWLIFATIAFWPLLLLMGIVTLGLYIKAAYILSETEPMDSPVKEGVKTWLYLIKQGILMNKDFVINGFTV